MAAMQHCSDGSVGSVSVFTASMCLQTTTRHASSKYAAANKVPAMVQPALDHAAYLL